MVQLTITPKELTLLQSLSPSDCRSVLQKMAGLSKGRYNHAEHVASAQAAKTRAHQNIGKPDWSGINHERRGKAQVSLKYHAETYHPETFYLPWADFHLKFIEVAERVVHEGGWFAFAVSRGFGKSKLSEVIVEWAALHGFKRWPVLIGASAALGEQRLKNVTKQLRLNKTLRQDFPEVCHPFHKLGRSARKAEGQHIDGVLTAIGLTSDEITFPTTEKPADWPYSDTNGTRVSAFGLTGGFRGMSETTEELKTIRPDLAVPDDPQTRESAKSVVQTTYRKSIITGEIAYLDGPDSPMSLLMPCTVIEGGDMADQVLSRDLHPEFRGQRHKMLNKMPERLELWDEYAEIYRECLRLDMPTDRATEFYVANRDAMDKGAEPSWPDRYSKKKGEISAIQHGMNRRLMNEAAFMAECQNEPVATQNSEVVFCPSIKIIEKLSHCEKMVVPYWASKIAVHLDVQQRVLYRGVVAGSDEFEASIIDYGTCPEQKRTFFQYREAINTIQDAFPDDPLDVQLYKAIQGELARIATTEFIREDGVKLSAGVILVDVGWKDTVVVKACLESPFKSLVIPSKGMAVRAKDEPLAFRKKKPGETKGHEWVKRPKPNMPSVEQILYNSNYWKTAVHTGLLAPPGPGCLTLFKTRPERHRMIAEHMNAETPTRVKVGDNEVDEWEELPSKPDNHLFDNIVNAFVGLSYLGCVLPGAHELQHEEPRRKRRKITSQTVKRRRM